MAGRKVHPKIDEALRIVGEMAGKDPLPVRSRIEIDFTRLETLMSSAFMVEVIDDGADYRFKYSGELLPVLLGINLCGLHLSEVRNAKLRDSIKETYDRVVRERRAAYLSGHYVRRKKRVPIERLLIPLLDDKGAVSAIWGVAIPDLKGHDLAELADDGPALLVGQDEMLPLA